MMGIVTMESNVLSTYRALECAASRLYSCAMDVTVAQAGVMADRNTVMRIALPSAIQVDAWMSRCVDDTEKKQYHHRYGQQTKCNGKIVARCTEDFL